MPSLLLSGTEMGQSLNLSAAPSLICKRPLSSHPIPTLAPMLLQQPDIGHGHAAVHGFAHVVDGEQSHLGDHTNQQLSHYSPKALARFLFG